MLGYEVNDVIAVFEGFEGFGGGRMPGTVLLLAASPVGKGRLVDAASVLPVLAAVDPAVLAGTDTANVVELADPLEPQAVLTRLRAAATAPGPLTVFVAGQLQLDRKQHLPHLALARTTPATVRYTGFPWAWVREELRLRAPGTTTLLLDLHTDAETWQWLHTHPLDSGRTNAVYGRIAPPPARRSVAVPAYMKAVATILRSGWRPPVEQLHQQAVERVGAEGYADVVLAMPGFVAAAVPGGSAPRPPSALKGPRPQTPDGLDYAGLGQNGAVWGEEGVPAGRESVRPSQEGALPSREDVRLGQGSAPRGQGDAPPSWEGVRPGQGGVPRGEEGAAPTTPDGLGYAGPSQNRAPQGQEGVPPGRDDAWRSETSVLPSAEDVRRILEGAGPSQNSTPPGQEDAWRSQDGPSRSYGSDPRGQEVVRPSSDSVPPSPKGVRPSQDSTPPGQEDTRRSQDSSPRTHDSAPRDQEGAPRTQNSDPRTHDGAPPVQEGAPLTQDSALPSQEDGTSRHHDDASPVQEGTPPTQDRVAPSQQDGTPRPHDDAPPSQQDGTPRPHDGAPLTPQGTPRTQNPTPPLLTSTAPTQNPTPPTPPTDDPHIAVASAAQAGRYLDADSLAAEHEHAAVRAHGRGSEEALHWTEVRADLAMLAGDPVRSCQAWLAVAGARLGAGQAPGAVVVEAAVDRAHHQWGLIQEQAAARELGLELAELRGRVPGRREGALDHVLEQLRQLQSQSLNS